MSDLHTAILNIRAVPPKDADINQNFAYKIGHGSARAAAASLALESDRRIAELEQDNASLREQNTLVDAKCAELEAALREAMETIKTTDNALRKAWDNRTLPADAIPSTVPQMAKASIAAIDKLLKD